MRNLVTRQRRHFEIIAQTFIGPRLDILENQGEMGRFNGVLQVQT